MAVKTVIANVLELRFLSENRLVVTVLLILLKLSNAQRYSVIRMHPTSPREDFLLENVLQFKI